MELFKKIAELDRTHALLPQSGAIIVAVSGGADSMCLLEALRSISVTHGFTVIAAHYNHQLRGTESERDADFVCSYCQSHHIPFYTECGDVGAYATSCNLGIEEAARECRYAYLQRLTEITSASRIATAHTADDNAETVLLNLTRGTGLKGLCGIPPKRDNIIRPILKVSRQEVMTFLEEHRVPYVEDSTNASDVYTRNKIRHQVIPILKALNPSFHEAVTTASSLLREDEQYLSSLSDSFIQAHCQNGTVDTKSLLSLPLSISSRVIRRLMGSQLSYAHVSSVLELCASPSPSAAVSLPGCTARREYERLIFAKAVTNSGFSSITISPNSTTFIPELQLHIRCTRIDKLEKINKSLTTFLFKSDSICGNIVVRTRQKGDKISLLDRNGSKTLKKLYIENKIPVHKRLSVPVISDDVGVLAVYGALFGTWTAVDVRTSCSFGDCVIELSFEENSHHA